MAGYSGTPLAKKLGIKEGSTLALVYAPEGFANVIDGMPEGAKVVEPGQGGVDVVVAFFDSAAALASEWAGLSESVFPAGGLWIAWPKRASKRPTAITEEVLREIGLPTGMVDNKVCAIDETWSGLRFAWRKELRKR